MNIDFNTDEEQCVTIGDFVLDINQSTVSSAEKTIKLEPLALAFLCFLVSRSGQVVSRDELLRVVWSGRVVSDDSIRKVVKKLREAFLDDAKAPRYIKTIPLKGYCLIAPVLTAEKELAVQQLQHKKHQRLQVSVLVVCLILIFSFFYLRYSSSNAIPIVEHHMPAVKLLTSLSGSELGATFSEKNQALVFIHRTHGTEPWQLYSKNMMSGIVKRLTWDEANYSHLHLSPDGGQLTYSRSNGLMDNTYLADFDLNLGLSNIKQLNPIGQKFYPLSWSVDGDDIYMADYNEVNAMQSLFIMKVTSKALKQITFPSTEGRGDYFVQESPDGKYFAVYRNVSDRKYMLLIVEKASQLIMVKKPLSFYADGLVWHEESNSMAMSSFKGDFYYYSMEDDRLVTQKGSSPGLNDVFYRCGEKCFYMRQHDINYTDIKEIPNPFMTNSHRATLHIEAGDAEFTPIYNAKADTLYYTAINAENAQVIKHLLGETPEVIAKFNPRYNITDLNVNNNETMLLGKVEERIFLLNLLTKELTYITSALEIVSDPTWNKNGDGIYFTRIERHKKILLKYEITTDTLTRLMTGVIHRKELTDGRIFIVDESKDLYEIMADESKRFIAKLPVVDNNYWQIQGRFLYFSRNSGNDFYLNRLDMTSNKQETHLMSENTWKMHFYLHPNGQRMLITHFVSGNSDLVEVRW
jgi:transcriptional activator of cad operon